MPQRATPNKNTPWIEHGLLHLPQKDAAQTIRVESQAWAIWLKSATRFYVKNEAHGNFSCRKETRQRGGAYWSAYRRVQGRAYHIYVGKDSDLTVRSLEDTAVRLTQMIHEPGEAKVLQRKKRIAMPTIQTIHTDESKVWFHLTDGRVVGAPLAWFPRLIHATPAQRQHWQIIGAGSGAHWPDIDEHISVRVLMNVPS